MTGLSFPSSLPRKLGDFTFQIPTTLRPGDTLSHNDAILYNVARAANICGAFSDRFKKLVDDLKAIGLSPQEAYPQIEAALIEYAATYSYSPRPDMLPPVDREMIAIAEAELELIAARQGKSFINLPRVRRESIRFTYIHKHSARIKTEAERRVSLNESLSMEEVDLDFSE